MPLRRSLFATALVALPALAQAQPAPLVVCATPDLQAGLTQLEALWRAQGGRPLRLQFAAMPALARQVEQGSPCDLLALPDPRRMDQLEQRRLLRPETRRSALAQQVVLLTTAARPVPRRLMLGAELPQLLGQDRLALPDPALSALGRAAREALAHHGQWEALATNLLLAPDAPTALELLRRDQARFAVATAADAAAHPEFRLALTFPAASHAPLLHAFALPRRADFAAGALLAFILGPDAAPLWLRLGFFPS